ncbi:peptidylprolyl cis-trans isomerase, putative [Syntrophotalea carbinolica DSM 2380]|uniref:Periplasmic chaperone PpiD n=1 Tax=Syntrophotalea carbinolica (strain DSM 2380 / NBRC 103641 / GraBd1) TaxID=338963 RepID=Q3A5Q7_SYNC1|nr:SurA N-terminal domain-containing protein [Syntrophotalea carbinolica]ABA88300.1 peptidylprolyl cis-trans isomerase, putative [Syntrophotalea carbinolica DSM 2380]
MLDLIRKKQRSVLVKIVFWTIIAAFVGTIFLVWGKGNSGSGGDGSAIAHVNGDAISYQDFQITYQNMRQEMEKRFGRSLPPEIEKQLQLNTQAYEQLVNRLLLLQEADNRDIAVDKDELRQAIADIPAFQKDGQFDRKRYQEVLAYQHLTSRAFERNMREQLLLGKVVEAIKQDAEVTDQDIDHEYRNRNEKIDLAFVKLAPGRYESKVTVTDEALQAYFQENREDFRQPEKIALRFVRFDPDNVAKDISVDDAAIQDYYDKHKDQYWVEEQVKASHILFRITAGLDEDGRQKKRAAAQKVLEQARAGKDFAQLARTHSDDAGSAIKGGALGYFTHGSMVPDFENVAFALKPGQISDLVETSMGYHIIKCEGRIEAQTKPLDDVRDDVRANLRKELARQDALDKAMMAYSAHRQDGDIDAAASANGLQVRETGLFSRGEAIDGLGSDDELSMAAFALKEGELARPIVRDQGVLTFVVKERHASYIPELKEARAEVERAYRRQESVGLARQAAEAVLAELKAGKKLADVARKEKVEMGETGLFPRSYGNFIPRIGSSEALATAGFALTKEAPVADEVYVIDGRFVVATLMHRMEADPAKLTDAAREQLRTSVLTNKREKLLTELVEKLKSEAKIKVEPTLQNILEGEKTL